MTAIKTRLKIATSYAGAQEDGSFAVVAETKSGRRFVLDHAFPTCVRASAFARKVTAKGSIDETCWNEVEPIYGTASWLALQAEASSYKIGMREGYVSLDQVPEALRAYL